MSKIRVFVTGVCGRMGTQVSRTILAQEDMVLVGAADVQRVGEDLGAVIGSEPVGVSISGPLDENLLRTLKVDILVDFTSMPGILSNAKAALKAGVVPVIGATGLDDKDVAELRELSAQQKTGVFIAPNFALGAVLMMKFAQEGAKYFPHVEIIELHHDKKLDAPSGTAIRTAEAIATVRKPMAQGNPKEREKLQGARGSDYQGFRIHSVRLPGLEAHQEVIFGGAGQSLTIRHDAYTRETYMPGVLLAIRRSLGMTDFVVGLDNYLD